MLSYKIKIRINTQSKSERFPVEIEIKYQNLSNNIQNNKEKILLQFSVVKSNK